MSGAESGSRHGIVALPGPVTGSYAAATRDALRRAGLSLVGLWAVLVGVQGAVGAAGNGLPMTVVAAAVGAAVVAGFVRSSLIPLFGLLAAALIWGLAVAASGPSGLDSTFFVWQEMLVALASLSLVARSAALVVVGSGMVATGWLLATGVDVVDTLASQLLLVALGLVAVASRAVLVDAAVAADTDAGHRQTVELHAVTERARREELLRIQRVLHDTVLNTLAGLRLPGARDVAEVRARCAADLRALENLIAPVAPSLGGRTTPPGGGGPTARATSITPVTSISGGLVAGLLSFVTACALLLAAGPVAPATAGVAALAVLLAMLVVLALLVRTGRDLRGPVGAAFAVAGAGVVLVAGWSASSCTILPDPPWPTVASALLLWLLALAGSPVRWLVLGAGSLMGATLLVARQSGAADGACLVSVVYPAAFALAGVAAAGVLVVALQRLSGRAAAEWAAAAQLAEWTEILAAMDDVRESRVRAARHGVEPLLRGLADGALDPADPGVARRCAVEESQLRSLCALGPVSDQSGQLLARVVLAAHDRGHLAELATLPDVPQPSLAEVDDAVQVLTAALAAFPEPTSVTITAFPDPDGGGAVTMVIAGRSPSLRPATSQVGRIHVTHSVFDDQVMVEVTWPG